jgi:uncharacterized phage protein (TIGR01671 family)
MKREIKFRAWIRTGKWDNEGDKRQFEMIDSDSLCTLKFEPFKDSLQDIDDEFYVMQFTGLLDKNGKEIYEDDIIDDGFGIYKIVFVDAYYAVAHLKISRIIYRLHEHITDNENIIEVIGNIYENPELLK